MLTCPTLITVTIASSPLIGPQNLSTENYQLRVFKKPDMLPKSSFIAAPRREKKNGALCVSLKNISKEKAIEIVLSDSDSCFNHHVTARTQTVPACRYLSDHFTGKQSSYGVVLSPHDHDCSFAIFPVLKR